MYDYSKLKIRKGIKIPEKRVDKGHGHVTSVLKEMKVGDSVLVGSRSQASYIASVARKMKLSMLSRSMKTGKVRVWRVRPEE